ncbi:hypothetical protein FACS1894132_14400 [Clostridia bacterium]|nr:hypothetical protein FACS1894132_14400 [Clostridia bacterium]
MSNDIKEMQTYLAYISKFISSIPRVVPDGIFNDTTKSAVKAFQREFNLPVSGQVTPETWDEIVAVYKIYKGETPQSVDVFHSNGMNPKFEYIPDVMLEKISEKFFNIPKDRSKAIRKIQKLSGIPESNEINSETWNRILKLYEITLR